MVGRKCHVALLLCCTTGKACVLVPYEKSMVETYHEWMQAREMSMRHVMTLLAVEYKYKM